MSLYGWDEVMVGTLAGSLYGANESSVGGLIAETIRQQQPENAFEILYQTTDVRQTINNFDTLQHDIEAYLKTKKETYLNIYNAFATEKARPWWESPIDWSGLGN